MSLTQFTLNMFNVHSTKRFLCALTHAEQALCLTSMSNTSLYCESIVDVGQSSYLCLSEAELSRELGSFGQREVLRLLKAPLQSCELVARVDRPRFADLFGFPVHHAHLGLWLLFYYNNNKQKTYL